MDSGRSDLLPQAVLLFFRSSTRRGFRLEPHHMIDMKPALPTPTYVSLLLVTVAALLALPTISDAAAVAAGVSIDVDLSNITHVVNP